MSLYLFYFEVVDHYPYSSENMLYSYNPYTDRIINIINFKKTHFIAADLVTFTSLLGHKECI